MSRASNYSAILKTMDGRFRTLQNTSALDAYNPQSEATDDKKSDFKGNRSQLVKILRATPGKNDRDDYLQDSVQTRVDVKFTRSCDTQSMIDELNRSHL